MNPADVRALLAVLMSNHDKMTAVMTHDTNFKSPTPDEYLQHAHYLIEASWKLPHPAGMDNSQLGVNEALALLASKGYQIIAPSADPDFRVQGNIWVDSGDKQG